MKEIFRQLSQLIRNGFLVLLILVATGLGIYRLLRVQLLTEEDSSVQKVNTSVYTQVMSATRGKIVDCNGETIVSNKTGYNLIVEKAYFPADHAEGNRILLETVDILQKADCEWNDTLPITKTAPYHFLPGNDAAVAKLKSNLNLNDYANAENCMDKLIEDYHIAEAYTPEQQRILAGIRYEMLLRDFSMSNVFYLANDVDIAIVTRIKELRLVLTGVGIIEEAIRTVDRGDVLPHEIGYVGPIFSREEYETLLKNGHDDYRLSDLVGKSGLESAYESLLRGINGTKQITLINGEVSDVTVTKEPVGGNTIQLTLSNDFQTGLQDTLADFCTYLRNTEAECRDVYCGAAVVLDPKDNAVLGMATTPTYDLTALMEDYNAVMQTANQPLVNRATDGLYRPGSTFKTITATAGLNSGIINANSSFYCNRDFHYIDTTFHCTGNHQYISVSRAIRVSCNIFFYEVGLKLGIDRLVDYEKQFGLGAPLGLESGDSGGYLACPETFEKLGIDWHVGEITQAAIGQSEVQVTPLQMAVVASTLANDGVRYQPHLVDSVWNNAMTKQISQTEPVIAANITQQYDGVYAAIEQGMIGAASSAMPAEYSLSGLGFDVAIKTGTPQSPRGTDSFVIGYAPVNNPEVAFCVAIEGGKNAKYMVRRILEQYAACYPDSTIGRALQD